jgi:hypothetical protein
LETADENEAPGLRESLEAPLAEFPDEMLALGLPETEKEGDDERVGDNDPDRLTVGEADIKLVMETQLVLEGDTEVVVVLDAVVEVVGEIVADAELLVTTLLDAEVVLEVLALDEAEGRIEEEDRADREEVALRE